MWVSAGQVGPPGGDKLSLDEAAAHFALWAIMKSPLVISADLRFAATLKVASACVIANMRPNCMEAYKFCWPLRC